MAIYHRPRANADAHLTTPIPDGFEQLVFGVEYLNRNCHAQQRANAAAIWHNEGPAHTCSGAFVDSSEVYVEMPDALLPNALPKGWTVANAAAPLTVAGPESDLKITFVGAPLTGSLGDCARAAWRRIDHEFDIPIRQQAEMPSTDGWGTTLQIVYDTPASEDRILVAIVRTLGDQAYVSLIDGTKAALSRRGAQIQEIVTNWKPAGLREPSLAGSEPKLFGEHERRAMNDFIGASMLKLRVPGVAVAIVQNGQTVYAEGFGVRKVGASDPVTPRTRFMIGSSTKPLTTLMMAKLVDTGRFDWSTPVTQVLPGFALADAEVTNKLEMRHTVSASTGMPRRDLDLIFRYRGIRPEDRMAEMKQMEPTTGFGELFQYSNYLVAAGGYAAAHSFAPDSSLADAYSTAMRQLVFDPLGMSETSVLQSDSAQEASPHGLGMDGESAPIDPDIEHFADAIAPAGSIWSTVLDMARYLRFELSNGANDAGEQVVSLKNFLARRQPAVNIDAKSSYGLGLFLSQRQEIDEISHDGNTLGFTSGLFFLPKHGIGMVVLANLRAANSFLLAVNQRLYELLLGAESKAESIAAAAASSLNESMRRTQARVKTSSPETAWIANFVGQYRCEELGPAEIFKCGTGYRIQFESWTSDLGAEEQSSRSRQIVLTSPPWIGVRLQVSDSSGSLILDGGQTKYTFMRNS